MTGQTNKPKRYEYLEGLSMEELEELLRESTELHREDEDAFIDAIADVIQRREEENPTGRLADVDEAWREFQTHFNTPEREGMSLYSDEKDEALDNVARPAAKKSRSVFTFRNIAAAAIIAICFATVLPHALGYENIFEMVGHWNDSLFHFVLPNQDPKETFSVGSYSSLSEALEENGVSIPLVPKISDEFELAVVEVTPFPEYKRTDFNAFYVNGDRNISIYIVQRDEPVKTRSYEKDGTLVEIYQKNGIDHYIYENNGRVSITWYTDVFECSLRGDVSIEETRDLVDSIYEGS